MLYFLLQTNHHLEQYVWILVRGAPEQVKKVKFYHPGKEYEGTEQERDLNMAKWLKEVQSTPVGTTPITPTEPILASAAPAPSAPSTSPSADGHGGERLADGRQPLGAFLPCSLRCSGKGRQNLTSKARAENDNFCF